MREERAGLNKGHHRPEDWETDGGCIQDRKIGLGHRSWRPAQALQDQNHHNRLSQIWRAVRGPWDWIYVDHWVFWWISDRENPAMPYLGSHSPALKGGRGWRWQNHVHWFRRNFPAWKHYKNRWEIRPGRGGVLEQYRLLQGVHLWAPEHPAEWGRGLAYGGHLCPVDRG